MFEALKHLVGSMCCSNGATAKLSSKHNQSQTFGKNN